MTAKIIKNIRCGNLFSFHILTKTNETINISRGKSQLVKKQLVEYIGSIL